MRAYEPSSRRPIAAVFRRTANAAVKLCVRWRIHPDVLSYASIAFSALAAVCFWQAARHPVLLLFAPIFCYLRLWLNMLDGMVALAGGTASPRGEIVNELPDRVSDIAIFVGVAHSGVASVLLGYWAAVLAVLTAYVGVLGQAAGVQREFSGLMSKPWRMVVLHAGAWGAFWFGASVDPRVSALDLALGIVIIGCVQTIWVRLHRIVKSLDTRAGSG